MLSQMIRAGLVDTPRGREGGYWLARPPAEISYGEIVRLTRGSLGAAALRQPARLSSNAAIASARTNAGCTG